MRLIKKKRLRSLDVEYRLLNLVLGKVMQGSRFSLGTVLEMYEAFNITLSCEEETGVGSVRWLLQIILHFIGLRP